MRDHVIKSLVEMAMSDPSAFLVTGDLGYAVLDDFQKHCPDQFINVGIAEQNMTAVAAGMALEGNTVFTYSIGNFPTLRCIEQIRNDVCYHNANVKILAVGGGFVYGNQGVTHHATEDIAMMRVLPGMRVYVPGDAHEAVACFKDACETDGPAYIRLARNKEDDIHAEGQQLDIRKLLPLTAPGTQVNVLAAGPIASEAVKLQERLADRGISAGALSVPCIKPFDEEGLRSLAVSSQLLVTMEEHSASGGLGGVCAEALSSMQGERAVLLRAGLNNEFSDTTGDQQYLRAKYRLTAETLAPVVEKRLEELQR